MFSFMPSIVSARAKQDTLVLERLFRYRAGHAGKDINDSTDNIYLKYSFNTVKRNPTLFLIPTMYTIAKGRREYMGETYGKITFKDINKYDIKRQVVVGSLSNYRRTMPIMLDYIIPALYDVSLFDEHILSPFNSINRKYYRYYVKDLTDDYVYVSFRPRIKNTQLIRGSAVVHKQTGRIRKVFINGEYDMIKFYINADMGDSTRTNPFLPILCETDATFKFTGNNIKAKFSIALDCPTTLPDSISNVSDMELMNEIRPYPLTKPEESIYRKDLERSQAADTALNKSARRNDRLRELAWDIIGDHMLNSIRADGPKTSIKFSPLLNPLYLSYSPRRGLSYKIKMRATYRFSENKELGFTPQLGYNFKIKKFFYNTPVRYTYSKKSNSWVEFEWRNGNRITNSSVLDMIKNEKGDTIDFSSLGLDYFDDEQLQLKNNVAINRLFDLTVGCVYHKRTAISRREMEELGKPTEYRSLAPQLTLGFHPYAKGPVFTANYERGLKGVLKSNIEYERWEFDASYKKRLTGLRVYNLRLGGGFYTNKSSNYFVDFSNFRENYLPDGWDDDWTGHFQLLNSQWYNASRYYIRANYSYESPLLLLTWMPLVGKYIETERIYINALHIEHISPYVEVGYGFTNRYFSIGLFGSFTSRGVHEFGSKFTFELFRKW